MKALLTGATGFVGSYLARELVEQDYEVYGFARKRADGAPPKRLVEQNLLDKITIIDGDLTDLSTIVGAVQQSSPDVIFHLGAQSYVPRSFEEPLETFRVNSWGTQNLLEAVRLSGVDPKIIFAGSSEEYGLQVAHEQHLKLLLLDSRYVFPEPQRVPELPINEHNPLRPLSPYAVSKIHGDALMRNYHTTYGLKTIVSRAFNHEGAGRGDNFVTSVIVRQCLALKHGLQPQIDIGNVNAFRDWSHVSDIVNGYILLSKMGRHGDVYVQGSMRTNSVLTYIMWTLERLGYQLGDMKTGAGSTYGDMSEITTDEWYGLKFEKTKADNLLLGGRLKFTPDDQDLFFETDKGTVKIHIDPSRFRPSDLPVLLSDTAKIQERGFKTEKTVKDIIDDQIAYYWAQMGN